MTTDIIRQIDGRDFGFTADNSLVVQDPSTGKTYKVVPAPTTDTTYSIEEANRILTTSTKVVAATGANLTLTQALHANRTILQNSASGCAIALPAATGTGDVYRVAVKTTITSVGLVVSCTPLTDVIIGKVWAFSDNAAQAVIAWHPGSTDNTVTLNGTTQGGYLGDELEFRDVASGVWLLKGFVKQTGTEATPFSHV